MKYLIWMLLSQVAILLLMIKYYIYVFNQSTEGSQEKEMGKIYFVGSVRAKNKKTKVNKQLVHNHKINNPIQ
jgi:hypothetical protein